MILQTLKNVFAEKPKQLLNPDTLLTLKYGETCPDFSPKLAVFDCFGKCPKHQIIIHFESLRCLNWVKKIFIKVSGVCLLVTWQFLRRFSLVCIRLTFFFAYTENFLLKSSWSITHFYCMSRIHLEHQVFIEKVLDRGKERKMMIEAFQPL